MGGSRKTPSLFCLDHLYYNTFDPIVIQLPKNPAHRLRLDLYYN